MPHVTLIDVARRAGVSKSTVSNVVRGAPPVAPRDTRPASRRRSARSATGRTGSPGRCGSAPRRSLGARRPRPRQPVLRASSRTASSAARTRGRLRRPDRQHRAATRRSSARRSRALMSRRVDGVALRRPRAGLEPAPAAARRGLPVVCAFSAGDDDRLGRRSTPTTRPAMGAIVDHLAELGHRRAGLRAPGPRRGRRRGAPPGASTARRAARGMEVVGLDERPTAIVAHNDTVAIEQMDRLDRAGLRVPEDVSVTGFDDMPLAAHALHPPDDGATGRRAGRRRRPPSCCSRRSGSAGTSSTRSARARRGSSCAVDRGDGAAAEEAPWVRSSSAGVEKRFDAVRVLRRRSTWTCRDGEFARPARAVRLRQDDRAADPGRARAADGGHGADRRPRRDPHASRATATSRWSSRATRSTRT